MVQGSIPNAYRLTGIILQSRNLKDDQPTDKIQSYSYLWSIIDKSGQQYLSLLPTVSKWATPNYPTHTRAMLNQPVGPVPLPVHTLTSYRWLIYDLIQWWIEITVLENEEWTESSELCSLWVQSTQSEQSTQSSLSILHFLKQWFLFITE